MPRAFLLIAFLFGSLCSSRAQHALPPSDLANDLCSCMGAIDPASNNRDFDLAVRHCLNTTVQLHAREAIELLRNYPAQDRRMYLLGLILGSTLDRSCPEYPLLKERLRTLLAADQGNAPST